MLRRRVARIHGGRRDEGRVGHGILRFHRAYSTVTCVPHWRRTADRRGLYFFRFSNAASHSLARFCASASRSAVNIPAMASSNAAFFFCWSPAFSLRNANPSAHFVAGAGWPGAATETSTTWAM